jgi:hypothetical protein
VGLDTQRTDYRFSAPALDGRMAPTTSPNVSVAELGWDAELKANFNARDGLVPLQITYELVDADEDVLLDNASINAEALLEVLDFLREYSDAHGGTIIQVLDRASIRFGYFGEDVPSYGFRCTFTVQERSTI